MKKFFLIIIMLILFPTLVLAKNTCNSNDIKIKSISLKELDGFSEEVQESSINNNTINLNLKMYDVGDSSTYYITIENTSREEYYFTKDSMRLENDYLEYSLKNDSETIPANSEKTVELKITYKNKIPNESYSDTNKLMISLSDKPLENPKTKMTYTFIFIIIILVIITIHTKINNKSISKKKLLLLITLLNVIPITTTALCTVNINVETKIEIDGREAIFLPGGEVNVKMKQLAGDDTSTEADMYKFQNENVYAVKQAELSILDINKAEKNIVSTSDSPYPIYMWYEDNTIYWWSEDKHPSLNEDASNMFAKFNHLNDISGIEEVDLSNTTKLDTFFWFTDISSLHPIHNWDVSNVNSMVGTFNRFSKTISDLSEIKDWDVSNLKNMQGMFLNTVLSDLSHLKKWNISHVTNMKYTFSAISSLESLEGLENWDTSNVTTMESTFRSDNKLQSIEELKEWDTSNVKTMSNLFALDTSIDSLAVLENWDVSNVEKMAFMFIGVPVESIEPLRNWNVSKVTTFGGMFAGNQTITDASPINNWNINKTAIFSGMFANTSTHPEFTKVLGTWSNGTFTPTT